MSGDDFGDWPTAAEQRRSQERAEMRRSTRAQEALVREMQRAGRSSAQPTGRPAGPEWVAIVRAYRAAQVRTGEALPSQAEVAQDWGGRSEDTLKRRLGKLGVRPYHAVHALVASEP